MVGSAGLEWDSANIGLVDILQSTNNFGPSETPSGQHFGRKSALDRHRQERQDHITTKSVRKEACATCKWGIGG